MLQEQLDDQGVNVVFLLGQGVGIFNTFEGWSGNLNYVKNNLGDIVKDTDLSKFIL